MCGDPIKVAETSANSNAESIVNMIGFNMAPDERAQLEEIAKASEAIFAAANNQDELKAEFDRAEKVLEAWREWKAEEFLEAEYQEVTSHFDILDITNDWSFKTDQLFNNISDLVYTLEEGIITIHQTNPMNERRNDLDKRLRELTREIETELEDISSEKVGEIKQLIEEKYSSQTDK